MQNKNKFLIGSALFVLIVLAFATNSGAFNTFRGAKEEAQQSYEHMQILRDTKKINQQILEQAKITNELLRQRR